MIRVSKRQMVQGNFYMSLANQTVMQDTNRVNIEVVYLIKGQLKESCHLGGNKILYLEGTTYFQVRPNKGTIKFITRTKNKVNLDKCTKIYQLEEHEIYDVIMDSL